MNFKDWLINRKNEVSTSTADVANFSRPLGDVHRRRWPDSVALKDSGFKYCKEYHGTSQYKVKH